MSIAGMRFGDEDSEGDVVGRYSISGVVSLKPLVRWRGRRGREQCCYEEREEEKKEKKH
jgi:hypothetical protein